MPENKNRSMAYAHKEEHVWAALSACTWLFFVYVFPPPTFGKAASFVCDNWYRLI